jgi:hypothetical protein
MTSAPRQRQSERKSQIDCDANYPSDKTHPLLRVVLTLRQSRA